MEINIKQLFGKQKKYTNWKILALLISGLLLGSIIWSVYFLYQYAYTTLNNADAIVVLNSNLGVDVIDNKAFSTAQNAIKLKKDLPEIGTKLRNIFYYGNENATSTSNIKK